MNITRKEINKIITEEYKKLIQECGDQYDYYQTGKCGGDYGQQEETGMVSSNLRSLADKAAELAEKMEQANMIEEWVQEKIAVAESMIDSIYDYISYNEQPELDEQSDYVGIDPAQYTEEDY